MKKLFVIRISTLIFTVLNLNQAVSQNPEWISYDFYDFYFSDFLTDIAFDSSGNAWITSTDGKWGRKGVLAKFDGTNWEKFYAAQTGLPKNLLRDIVIDKKDNIWVGSSFGVLKYDKNNFTIFNTDNSLIHYNSISDVIVDSLNVKYFTSFSPGGRIEIFNDKDWNFIDSTELFFNDSYTYIVSAFVDRHNNKWFASVWGHILKYDNNNLIYYDTLNKLNKYGFNQIEFANDSLNNLWLCWEYPVKFDGTTWTFYKNLPYMMEGSIAVDRNNTVWFGGGNLTKLMNDEITIWDTTNSPLKGGIKKIIIDKHGNKWMIDYKTLQIFREGGVIGITDVEEDKKIEQNKILCYPNPSTGAINLRYRIETTGIINIFLTDILGNKTLLKTEYKFPGDYVETFNLNVYPQGIYNINLITNGKQFSNKFLLLK